eukprot:superscaffoldBa00001947_g12616
MVASAAIGGTLQYGFNLAIMNSPTTFIQTFINETIMERWDIQLEDYQVTLVWTIIVSIFSLGGFAGAIIAGPMTIRFGRKKCLLLSNIFLMSGSLLALTSRAARSFEMIIISRVLVGINAALRRLRGCEVQSSELDEILQEQAETKGMRPSRPWELFADRSVRWQLISVIVISSAMQLCGNDSNLLIERKGRRFMLMGGFILMTVWAVVFTIALSFE